MSDATGIDLRLVPSAVAAWLAAAAGTRLVPPGPAAVAAAALLVAGAVLLGLARAPHPAGVRPGRVLGPARGAPLGPARGAALGAAFGAAGLALVVAAATLGSAAADGAVRAADPATAAAHEEAVVTIEGRVTTPAVAVPAPWEHGPASRVRTVVVVAAVTVRGSREPSRVAVEVTGGPAWRDVVPGARVVVTGRLRATPDRAQPAAMVAGEPRTVAEAPALARRAGQVRAGLRDVTAELAPDVRGLLPGLAVGDTGQLAADLDEAMTRAGLAHLTAVSGGHVAAIGAAVLALAGLLRLPRPARAALLLVSGGAFLLVAQPGASVARAAVMGCVAIAGLALGRRSSPVPALAAAVVGLLVVDPWWATSYGFVLSVVATAAIALLGVPAAACLAVGGPRSVVAAITVPLAAQSACGPVLVLLDPSVSLWAVPANVAAAPVVLPATLGGLVAALLQPAWPEAAQVVAHVAAVPTAWIAGVARVAAALPGSSLPWASGPAGFVACAALTAAAWLAAAGVARTVQTRRRG